MRAQTDAQKHGVAHKAGTKVNKLVRNAPVTAMAVIAPRVVSAVSAVSARTVRRVTASHRWKAFQPIPRGQMRRQPPSIMNRVLAILQ